MRIQLENVNKNLKGKCKWKFNLEMEIKVHLEIVKKVYENNKNCKLADEKNKNKSPFRKRKKRSWK